MKKVYVACTSGKDVTQVVLKSLKKLEGFERIGVLTTAQHLGRMDDITKVLTAKGKKPVIGGQVLGCNALAASRIEPEVDAFLYVGSGLFHPLAIADRTEKPVFMANPYANTVTQLSPEDRTSRQKKRKARVMGAAQARVYGILVSTKIGQQNYALALKVKERIESAGKKAYIFAGRELSPDRLLGYRVDAYVNTACPRLPEDFFCKPVIGPGDLDYLFPGT
jgi:2-(3-amino-3-carboxypropyl)histidine synthase